MMRRVLGRGVALAVTLFCLVGAPAAQGQVDGPAEAFEPVRPGDLGQEQLPATPLVFAAYAFVWLAVLAYVFYLWRRLTAVERELADVSARLRTRRP